MEWSRFLPYNGVLPTGESDFSSALPLAARQPDGKNRSSQGARRSLARGVEIFRRFCEKYYPLPLDGF
jgi:hypothetical protein